jgi:hypothetical protein
MASSSTVVFTRGYKPSIPGYGGGLKETIQRCSTGKDALQTALTPWRASKDAVVVGGDSSSTPFSNFGLSRGMERRIPVSEIGLDRYYRKAHVLTDNNGRNLLEVSYVT